MMSIRKYLLPVLLIPFCFGVKAQESPLKWNYSAKKTGDKTYEIHLTATIENGWHTYSQTTPEGGPVATNISFIKNPLIMLTGVAREEGRLQQKHEEVFGVDVKYFSDKVDFVQLVKLKAKAKTVVSGTIEYMVCTDERCMPPVKAPFSVTLSL